jgi:hypothetical protein
MLEEFSSGNVCFFSARHRSSQYMAEFPNVAPQDNEKGIEYEGYNGWFNNRGKHDLGAVGKI